MQNNLILISVSAYNRALEIIICEDKSLKREEINIAVKKLVSNKLQNKIF